MNEHIKAEPEQILFTVFELERAIKAERERIIKLLDENQKCRLDGGCDTQGYCFCIARQLIKGEN